MPLMPERFGSCFSMKEMYDERSTAHVRGAIMGGSSVGFANVGLTRSQILRRYGVKVEKCIFRAIFEAVSSAQQ